MFHIAQNRETEGKRRETETVIEAERQKEGGTS